MNGSVRRAAGRPAVFVACAALATAGHARGGDATIVAADAMLTIAAEVEVSATAEGVLRDVAVREGSLVARGDALLRVDDRRAQLAGERAALELQRAAEEARSDVKVRHAQKANELARSEHQRALAIDAASPSSVSDRELDRLRLSSEAAGLDVERAEHERRMTTLAWRLSRAAHRVAQQDIADHAAAAPIAGLVVEVHKRAGEWVGRGDPVVTLVRVDRLRAEAFVHVSLATLDLTGARAVFRTELPSGEAIQAAGEVVFVSPKADPVSSLARVWMELPVTDRRLRPGLRGTVSIDPTAGGSAPEADEAVARSAAVQGPSEPRRP